MQTQQGDNIDLTLRVEITISHPPFLHNGKH